MPLCRDSACICARYIFRKWGKNYRVIPFRRRGLAPYGSDVPKVSVRHGRRARIREISRGDRPRASTRDIISAFLRRASVFPIRDKRE